MHFSPNYNNHLSNHIYCIILYHIIHYLYCLNVNQLLYTLCEDVFK